MGATQYTSLFLKPDHIQGGKKPLNFPGPVVQTMIAAARAYGFCKVQRGAVRKLHPLATEIRSGGRWLHWT